METTSDAHKSTLRRTADARPSVAIANPAALPSTPSLVKSR
jgi:hypothetical protein